MQGFLPGTIADKVGHQAQCIFNEYVDNVFAYCNGGQSLNEELMRNIEEGVDIPEGKADDFRRQMAAFFGNQVAKGRSPDWMSNPVLRHAIISYIVEQNKECLKIPQPLPKYRRTDDPWKPAW